MDKSPVMTGVGGAAILAAFLSFSGGNGQKAPVPQKPDPVKTLPSDTEAKATAPNQDGPWGAVCAEYAPNGAFDAKPTQLHRGYIEERGSLDRPDGTTEVSIGPDKKHQIKKITVHKRSIGDLKNCIPKDQLKNIHLIIATVPDPDKTEMRLEFDRDIDALEKAAAIREFSFTGYWFPWNPRQSTSPPHKEEDVEAALLRLEQPGILLFHNERGERLFIFIVGETPTSGIDRAQMVSALRYRQDLIKSNGQPEEPPAQNVPPVELTPGNVRTAATLTGPLMIAGPHYSGSLLSLGEVLYEGNLLGAAKIVSPENASDLLIDKFNDKFCKSHPGCLFRSLSLPVKKKNASALEYLQRLGYQRQQIAELIEDESGFGTATHDSEDADASDKTKQPVCGEGFCTVLTFPRELSAVRSLSDRKSQQLAESGAKLLSFTKDTEIKLASQNPVERDRPPTYASEAEVSEISDRLEDDLRVLKDKRIQCVLISATNPLDRAFLLEYLHDQLPNVRLLVEDGDAIEISHPHFVDLTGTIVISTLPIVPERVIVGDKSKGYQSFADIASEDEFLTVAMLLDPSFGKPESFKNRYPNRWTISIVGEEEFALIPPESRKKDSLVLGEGATSKQEDKNPVLQWGDIILQWDQPNHTPRGFKSFAVAVFALTLLHLIRVLNANRPKLWNRVLVRFGYDSGRPPKFAYVDYDGDQAFGRSFHLLALNNQIFLLNCLLLAVNPFLWPFSSMLPGLNVIAFFSWLMVVLTGWVAVILLAQFSGVLSEEMRRGIDPIGRSILVSYSIAMCWYLVSSVIFLWHWRSDGIAEWQRVLALSNNLSPVWPIAAIVFAWALWAALQLQRVKWICHRKMDLLLSPTSEEIALPDGTMGGWLCEDMKQIHETIDAPTVDMKSIVLTMVFLVAFLYTQQHSFFGIEHDVVDAIGFKGDLQFIHNILVPPSFRWWFATWGVAMLLVTVIQTAFQIYRMWRALARMLGRLDLTRMKRAFEQIGKDDRIHIKLWDLGKSQLRFDEMTLIVASLHKMGDNDAANEAQKALEDYQNVDLRGEQPSCENRNALNRALNVHMKGALQSLSNPETAVNTEIASCWQDYLQPSTYEFDRYLALRLTTLIRYVLLQMRNLMWFVVYGFFLAVLSVAFYPFQGGRNLSNLLGTVFTIVLVIMVALVADILRSPMLKRLEDRESNIASVLQASFHLLSVGGLPLLALLAWQFPWIGQIAFSWLRPLLNAVR